MKSKKILHQLVTTGFIAALCVGTAVPAHAATVVRRNVTGDSTEVYNDYDYYDNYGDDSYGESGLDQPSIAEGSTPTEIVSVNKNADLDNVLYTYNGVTVTLKRCYDDQGSLRFEVILENNTSEYVALELSNISLDGYMGSSSYYIEAGANSRVDEYFYLNFDNDNNRYLKTKNVADIEFEFLVYHFNNASYSYDGILKTNPIKFHINNTSGQSNNNGRSVLYNQNGIKIVKIDSFIKNYGAADAHVVLQLENNSDQILYFTNNAVIINGYSSSSNFSSIVHPGKKAIQHLIISASKLEELNINKFSDIKELRTDFSVTDYTSYSNYYEIPSTDMILINTPLINLLK